VEGTNLSTLATDAAGQLDVLGHDGHTLGVDGSQVGVLEQTHQVGLSSLLQGQDCAALEAQVGLEVLGNLTHQALEGQLANQQLRALLVLTDLTQSHGTRAVSAGNHNVQSELGCFTRVMHDSVQVKFRHKPYLQPILRR
jgi:hypothetical protein